MDTTPDNKPPVSYDLIRQLYEAFQDMNQACLGIREAVVDDADQYPVYVPTFAPPSNNPHNRSEGARDAAVRSMVRLHYPKEGAYFAEAGILCASPGTVDGIVKLNAAKQHFKDVVLAIRAYDKKYTRANHRIEKLIADEIEERGYRTDAIRHAMKTVRIETLDLKKCYSQIRIMPAHLTMLSWTWATTHSRMRQVSMEEAFKLARSLQTPKAREQAGQLLQQCDPDEHFVIKKKLPNQLRANYAYEEKGQLVRKSSPISGIVIAQQRHLPRYKWRNDPGELDEESREIERESQIEAQVYISTLHLYRYVESARRTSI